MKLDLFTIYPNYRIINTCFFNAQMPVIFE
jgi:hypothetical protein